MGSKLDVVQGYYDNAWSNPPASLSDAIDKYYSDDFQTVDSDGNVLMNKPMLKGMSLLMVAAFEGLKAVVDEIREVDEGVYMKFHFEGKFTNDFDLSSLEIGVIPATGEYVVWPSAATIWVVAGDQIVGEKPQQEGMDWFLSPLGVTLPERPTGD